MANEIPKLKACPFCGSTDIRMFEDADHSTAFIVVHPDIDCIMDDMWIWGENAQSAADKWNSRRNLIARPGDLDAIIRIAISFGENIGRKGPRPCSVQNSAAYKRLCEELNK